MSVEATGKIVRDRQTVGFFFHLVGFILFVRYLMFYKFIIFTKVKFYFKSKKCMNKKFPFPVEKGNFENIIFILLFVFSFNESITDLCLA